MVVESCGLGEVRLGSVICGRERFVQRRFHFGSFICPVRRSLAMSDANGLMYLTLGPGLYHQRCGSCDDITFGNFLCNDTASTEKLCVQYRSENKLPAWEIASSQNFLEVMSRRIALPRPWTPLEIIFPVT